MFRSPLRLVRPIEAHPHPEVTIRLGLRLQASTQVPRRRPTLVDGGVLQAALGEDVEG
jgi:hypothetical protein